MRLPLILEQGNRVMNISLSIFVKSCACGSSEWEYTCNYDDADFPSVPMNDFFFGFVQNYAEHVDVFKFDSVPPPLFGGRSPSKTLPIWQGGSSESLKLKWSVHSGRATSPPSTELLRTNTGRSVS